LFSVFSDPDSKKRMEGRVANVPSLRDFDEEVRDGSISWHKSLGLFEILVGKIVGFELEVGESTARNGESRRKKARQLPNASMRGKIKEDTDRR